MKQWIYRSIEGVIGSTPHTSHHSVGQSPPEIKKVQSMLTDAAAKIRSCLEERHASLVPTPEELKDISLACGRLWYVWCG